jgi:hypothetical protein
MPVAPLEPREEGVAVAVIDEIDENAKGTGYLIQRPECRRVTIVAFAGLKRPSRTFEFFRLLSAYEEARCVFLSDHEQGWYQLGVRGIGDTADDVASFLSDVVGDDRSTTIFTGASAGGYAALLFGSLLGIGEVHAFAPQTFVSKRLRLLYRDRRWATEIGRMHSVRGSRPVYLDIKRQVKAASPATTALHVHVGTLGLDERHARRVRNADAVTVHRYDEISLHGVARTLNEDGRLQAILDEAMARADARAASAEISRGSS